MVTFSPDGSRLVVTTNDPPAVHVWDLRAVRRRLAEMGLDWNAAAYSETDSATENAADLPLNVVVNMGRLNRELQSLVHQAEQLRAAGKIGPAIEVLRLAARVSPDVAEIHNNLAWLLATAPGTLRNLADALQHARRATELEPGTQMYLNTFGVALYRAGKFAEATITLEKSVKAGKGQFVAFDFFFLAMAHHRLGHRGEARDCFDRAVQWLAVQKGLSERHTGELAAFRAEAAAVLAGHIGELPDEVFAHPR